MTIISIDPGKHNGVATFTDEGVDIKRKTMDEEEFLNFLQMLLAIKGDGKNKIHFVVEDFKLRHDKAMDQVGSDMPAARMVGAVQMITQILGSQASFSFSKPADLRGSLKWAGLKNYVNMPRTYHIPDDIAAYAHGVKYLIDEGLRKHPIFDSE